MLPGIGHDDALGRTPVRLALEMAEQTWNVLALQGREPLICLRLMLQLFKGLTEPCEFDDDRRCVLTRV